MKKIVVFLMVLFLFIISIIHFSCNKSTTTNGTTPPPGGTATATIDMINMTFSPAQVTVTKGTIVTWVNEDGYAHHVLSNDSTSFDSGVINGTSTSGGGYYGGGGTTPGGTYSYTANVVDTFPYHCTIHGFAMSGVLIVKP